MRLPGSHTLESTSPLQRVPQVLISEEHHWDLISRGTELGSMVELAVVCAATKLAKSATATVDFANILRFWRG